MSLLRAVGGTAAERYEFFMHIVHLLDESPFTDDERRARILKGWGAGPYRFGTLEVGGLPTWLIGGASSRPAEMSADSVAAHPGPKLAQLRHDYTEEGGPPERPHLWCMDPPPDDPFILGLAVQYPPPLVILFAGMRRASRRDPFAPPSPGDIISLRQASTGLLLRFEVMDSHVRGPDGATGARFMVLKPEREREY